MIDKILNLKGISKLDIKKQQSIMAGTCSSCPGEAFIQCVLSCSGTCSISGTCYQILH